MAPDPLLEHADNPTAQGTPLQTIRYAVIGYGASAGQFIADLALQRLELNLINKNEPDSHYSKYNIEVTVYSSQDENEDGAGDAWGSKHDGCINSSVPPHGHSEGIYRRVLELAESDDTLKTFVEHVMKLDEKLQVASNGTDGELQAKLEKINSPGAALLHARMQNGKLVTNLPCVPRYLLGEARAKSLQAIVKYANEHIHNLKIEIEHEKWAIVESVKEPEKPSVKSRSIYSPGYEAPIAFDKVISFSGARRKERISADARHVSYIGLPNAELVEKYLKKRGCDKSKRNVIGFAGAQLSFIDLIAVVGTVRDAFSFKPEDGTRTASCKSKIPDGYNPPNKFLVFTPNAVGSVKPRLSYGMNWPGEPPAPGKPVSYLKTEHLLALRTQKGYNWLEVVETIWHSMICYRKARHPSQHPEPKTMHEEWTRYNQDCKWYREDKPTFCGLERILVNAAAHGYGAEEDVAVADQRMREHFPAIFVSGTRMYANLFAHVSSLGCVKDFGPNKGAIRILEKWYRTYSSSPIDICEPIYELAVNGVMEHRIGNALNATYDKANDKIVMGDYQVDALFAPTPFSEGIDDVISHILESGELKVQTRGIPLWHANGQLENQEGKLVNVWDCGNNRGAGLKYEHEYQKNDDENQDECKDKSKNKDKDKSGGKDKNKCKCKCKCKDTGKVEGKGEGKGEGDKDNEKNVSIIKPRCAVHSLTAAHEFAPSISACLLAHDVYTIQKERAPSETLKSPSESLQDAIMGKQPSRDAFNTQMKKLNKYYDESMEHYEYLKAIQAPCIKDEWMRNFEEGKTPEGRRAVMKRLKNSENYAEAKVADDYCAVQLPRRNAMSYEEWHGVFHDQEVSVAWNILQEAIIPGRIEE